MDSLRAFPSTEHTTYMHNTEHTFQMEESIYLLLMQALTLLSTDLSTDGIALLASARERLPSVQEQIIRSIDDLLQSHITYKRTHEELLHAITKLVAADNEQQAQIDRLKVLLSSDDKDVHESRLTSTPYNNDIHKNGFTDVSRADDSKTHLRPTPLTIIPTQQTSQDLLPPLNILCFGHFEVLRESQPLTLCQNRNGQAIFRYLVAQQNHRATIDTLIEAFWPDDEPKRAQHKLQVAVSALRRSLNQGYNCDPGGGYILHKNKIYQINPAVSIISDIATFFTAYEQGLHAKETECIIYYEQACQLYKSSFLTEDIYVDWTKRQREQYRLAYVTMCSTLAGYALQAGNYDVTIYWAGRILVESRSNEAAHRQLMQTYMAQGRRSDAIHQYQLCKLALLEECEVTPSAETTHLFEILSANDISSRAE